MEYQMPFFDVGDLVRYKDDRHDIYGVIGDATYDEYNDVVIAWIVPEGYYYNPKFDEDDFARPWYFETLWDIDGIEVLQKICKEEVFPSYSQN